MSLASFLSDSDDPALEDDLAFLLKDFGGVVPCAAKLLGFSLGSEGWVQHFLTLKILGWVYQGVLLAFVLFSQLALLNVILGLFVDSAMKNMVSGREERAKEHEDEQKTVMQDLMEVLWEADEDQSGRLSQEEWEHAVNKGKVLPFLESVGLRARDAKEVFHIFANQSDDGKVDVEGFVKTCYGLKGNATPYNILSVLFAINKMEKHVCRMLDRLDRDVVAIDTVKTVRH